LKKKETTRAKKRPPAGQGCERNTLQGSRFAKVQKYNAYSEWFYIRGLLLRDDEIDNVHAKVLRWNIYVVKDKDCVGLSNDIGALLCGLIGHLPVSPSSLRRLGCSVRAHPREVFTTPDCASASVPYCELRGYA
jgi:hypothetical protein